MTDKARHRVVVLAGTRLWHRNTCATVIAAGVNVVGICTCDERVGWLPLKQVLRSCKRYGVLRAMGQIAGRIVYKMMNARLDNALLHSIFDEAAIQQALDGWKGSRHATKSYSDPATLSWLEEQKPDIILVHSSAWVGKKVRELARLGMVIGGHPGLTPRYRGSHSAFWAIYRNEPQNVGCSVFWLDSGVDTGDLVKQESIPIENGDSYFSLGWKAMRRIAEIQAKALLDFDAGTPMARVSHREIPPDSDLPVPTLGEYIRYRWRQNRVR